MFKKIDNSFAYSVLAGGPIINIFTIGKDGVPLCKEGLRMHHDGSEPSKYRIKYRCPLASRKYGCSCEHP